MPTRIFLLRHAESSAPHVFHGLESDVDLSPLGHRQAATVAATIASYSPHVLISSGMKRAVQTATPIAEKCGLTLQLEPMFHERKVGALSGQPYQREGGLWPDTLNKWMQGDTDYAPEGAESFDQIRDRIVPVWERLTNEHSEKTLVVVAHGIVCKVLLLTLNPHWTVANWHELGPIQNVAIHEFRHHENVWEVVRWNEVVPEVAALRSPEIPHF